ncbi:hypothetical protein [Novosphingobium barchaimii]|nr:hypothetical protein [Novosphingobium barchaimii]
MRMVALGATRKRVTKWGISMRVSFERSRSRLLAFALLAGTALGGMVAGAGIAAAQDQGAQRGYDIPPGWLADVPNRLAEQSGLQMTYEAALTQGHRTLGLRGSFAPRDAPVRLHSGTGLAARRHRRDAVSWFGWLSLSAVLVLAAKTNRERILRLISGKTV